MIMMILLSSPYCGEGINGPLGPRLSINLLTRYSVDRDDSDDHHNDDHHDKEEEETVRNNGVFTKYFKPKAERHSFLEDLCFEFKQTWHQE